jgi:hypothetical protein
VNPGLKHAGMTERKQAWIDSPLSHTMNDAYRWMQQMRNGDFAAAWQISDRIFSSQSRWRSPDVPRHVQLVWNREPLANQRVLVRCYHGLGDTIQFIRYAPLLKEIAARVTIWAQPTLIPLLTLVDGIDEILPLHDGTPECAYDLDVEIMELPYVFRSTVETIPATVPYIHVTPARLEPSLMKVGVVWRAGAWDPRRNVPFPLIRWLTGIRGVDFYALQLNPHRPEATPFKMVLTDTDVRATAGVMAALDLVISIDSMPAHLAGALGIPTWTLLPESADWRWMQDRTDSPWYPTMRLFRQRRAGSWDRVIENVADELVKVVGSKKSGSAPSLQIESKEINS